MATILPARRLTPGLVLKHDLFSRQGIRLLHAVARLDAGVCRALTRSGEPYFVMARDAADAAHAAKEEPGHSRTAKEKATLPARPWAVRYQELGAVRAAMLRDADALLARREPRLAAIPRRAGTTDPVHIQREDAPGWLGTADLAAMRHHAVAMVADAHERLCRGTPPTLASLVEMVDETTALYARHPRRFAQLATAPFRPGDALAEHAYTALGLCVSMAARLGWSRTDIRHAGLAALLADAGMRLVHEDIRSSPAALDDAELNRMRRHVALSGLLSTEIDGLPEAVTLAIMQHHERDDGTGYPRAA
ncbi:MAG: HD domain-containing phosphohydrolase, partial [Phycisphaerales bacterium]